MKSWMVTVTLAILIALSSGYPIPEDESHMTISEEDGSKGPSVFDDYEEDQIHAKLHGIRSVSSSSQKDASAMISKALEDVSETLGTSFKNLGNSAIQIIEGSGVAAEQALGTGARIVTGVAETAAEAAETGAKSAIRIAHGVANSLTHGTRSIVETKTNLLKGLTGGSAPSLQADASSTNEAVQRQERQSYGGYSSTSGYGAPEKGFGETPNNFVNVFSQAAANTVNFGTQLLNSLVGVAANILQGTVSTLLSLLNAKGQVVGAVVQSAPPVLASVTRTAGDVLAAKARIFGAVTQAAVSFGSQLARTFGDTFGGLFNRINSIGGTGSGESDTVSIGTGRGSLGGILAALGGGNKGSSSSEGGFGLGGGSNRGIASILAALQAGGGSRDLSSSQGSGLLGGIGNLAQTLLNAKLNLLNGLLSPFTGGRPLINLGNRANYGSSSSSSSGGGGYGGGTSESNFRISIASTPAPIISLGSSDESSSSGPRNVRFYVAPDATFTPKLESQLSPGNLLSTFSSGIFKGFVDQLNSNLQASLARNAKANNGKGIFGSFDSSGNYATKVQPASKSTPKAANDDLKASSSEVNVKTASSTSSKEVSESFSKILPKLYAAPTTFKPSLRKM